ncbi:hypothetical protein [Clostridium sp. B9]|uniref:hypothetical protein n=1 Tax=Clostridium sp. B9 TaxID=3423224 RepID=UPI003D2F3E87
MTLKEIMDSATDYLSLGVEKQQYVAGIIRGLAIAEQITKEKHIKEMKKED